MDAATWKTIAQIAMVCGVFLVAGGMLVSYVAGDRIEAAREREARERYAELQGRLEAFDQRNRSQAARATPLEDLARQPIPGPAPNELSRRSGEEPSSAAETATRSAPPAGIAHAEDEVVRRLKALVQRGEMPILTVDVANLSTTSIRHVFVALLQMLKKAGAPHRVGSLVEALALDAPDQPYRVVTRPGDEDVARRLVEAFQPFLRSEPVFATDDAIPRGAVVVDLQPQAVDFHGDGSVGLR
jgi:hypothetical protein